jgi:4-hydroxy-4-methyl-2-oxoglutarate aldolase
MAMNSSHQTADRIHATCGHRRPDCDLVKAYAGLSSATVYEASGKNGALHHRIKPMSAQMKLCGPALTVLCRGADNLMIHKAVDMARPGDVLVVSVVGDADVGFWGDVLTTSAQARQIAGLVIDGCVRDKIELIRQNFPVFSRGVSIRGTTKAGLGLINHPMSCADALIWPGDLILGDADGVVCVDRERLDTVLMHSRNRDEEEEQEKAVLRESKISTYALYNFDTVAADLGMKELNPNGN